MLYLLYNNSARKSDVDFHWDEVYVLENVIESHFDMLKFLKRTKKKKQLPNV